MPPATAEGSQADEKFVPITASKRRRTVSAPRTPPDSFFPFSDEFSNWCLRVRQKKNAAVPLIVIDDVPDHRQ